MAIKKSEITITEANGWYQVVVRDCCVTEPFKSKDAAYRDYIKQLIDAVEDARAALIIQTW